MLMLSLTTMLTHWGVGKEIVQERTFLCKLLDPFGSYSVNPQLSRSAEVSWALRELPNCCCLLSVWLFSVICGHLKYILQLKLNSGASIPFSILEPLQLETKLNSSAAPSIEPAIEVYNLYPSLIKLKSANKCEMNGNASIMYANVFFWTRLLLLV